jgi:excisionase family DNA binding protein
MSGTPLRTLTTVELADAVGHSTHWVHLHAKAGRLPGTQVAHPCVTGRLTWRFNLKEAQAAIEVDPDLWGMQGIKPGREAPGKRPVPDPPDDHHTLTGRTLAEELRLHVVTVATWARHGEIPSVFSGTRRWYNLEDVKEALEQRKQRPKPKPDPPDKHHTLGTEEISAAFRVDKATILSWVRKGIVPSVLRGNRRWYNLKDTRTALLRAGKLKSSSPLAPPANRAAPPDDHHTMIAAEAVAHALEVLAPGKALAWLNTATIQTWVRKGVLSGVQRGNGSVWVNPEATVRLVGSLQGTAPGKTSSGGAR